LQTPRRLLHANRAREVVRCFTAGEAASSSAAVVPSADVGVGSTASAPSAAEGEETLGVGARSWPGEAQALARLALPLIAVQLGLVGMGSVDVAMVGRVSAEALAGLSLGNQYKIFVLSLGFGALTALEGVVSQSTGANDRRGAGAALIQGMALAVVYSLVLAPLLAPALSMPLWALLGQPAHLLPMATRYAELQALAVLPTLVFIVLRISLQVQDRVRPILAGVLLANLLNIPLNAALIFGVPTLGIPALGPIGSAWATVACSWIMPLVVALLGREQLRTFATREAFARAKERWWASLAGLVRLGLPVGLHQQMEVAAFSIMLVLMGLFGAETLAAHSVAMSVAVLTWNLAVGIGAAAAIRAGKALGRGDAQATARVSVVALALITLVMAAITLALCTCPQQIGSVWTSDTATLAQAVVLLPVAGMFQVSDGLHTVAAGILRGLSDTRWLLVAGVIGYFVVGLPASLIFSRALGLGAPGVWLGMVAGLSTAALLLVLRLSAVLRKQRKTE